MPVDYKNQHDILRCQIIRFNLSAQELNIRKSEIHYKKIIRPKKTTEKTNYMGLSAKGTGRLFGLSKESGSRIRRKLKRIGLLSVLKKVFILINEISEPDYWRMKSFCLIPAYSYYDKGRVLIQRHPEIKYLIS